ncbi:MAG: hypothetical protein IPL46_30390 [Saprospiraceae bacterium]|nr:hypothetical protein [Saprospiraceae bacterium]
MQVLPVYVWMLLIIGALFGCIPPGSDWPDDPCPHVFQYRAVLAFEYDSATQRCSQTRLQIFPRQHRVPEVIPDTLDLDIALATFRRIEIYCPQIIIDSMLDLDSHYRYFELEITHCHQFSIRLEATLESSSYFITSFIFSIP